MVSRSHGAYTHDDIYYMKAEFVMMMSLMYYEQDQLQQRRYQLKKLLQKKESKNKTK